MIMVELEIGQILTGIGLILTAFVSFLNYLQARKTAKTTAVIAQKVDEVQTATNGMSLKLQMTAHKLGVAEGTAAQKEKEA